MLHEQQTEEFLCKVLWTDSVTKDQLTAAAFIARQIQGGATDGNEIYDAYQAAVAKRAFGNKHSPVQKRKCLDLAKALVLTDNRHYVNFLVATSAAVAA